MSITGQLDTQSRANNVVKLGMRRGTVMTTPSYKSVITYFIGLLDNVIELT